MLQLAAGPILASDLALGAPSFEAHSGWGLSYWAPPIRLGEKSLPHRRLNRAEQPNKLHIFVLGWTAECTAICRATVIGHGVRQCTHDHSALGSINHDLVFVVDRHQQSPSFRWTSERDV